MGIAWWKSAIFFVSITVFGIGLIPSGREMGKLYTESDAFDKAQFYLEKQFHEDPYDLANAERYLRSLIYHDRDTIFLREAGKLARMHPKNMHILKLLAEFYEDRMDYPEASEYWLRLLRIDPELEDFREKLLSYYRLGKKYRKLREFYESEVERETASLNEYHDLARLYALSQDTGNSEKIYKMILQKSPGDNRAKTALADIYLYKGEVNKAIAMYRDIVSGQPDNINYALIYADLLIKYRKDEEAKEAIKSFLTRFPRDERLITLLSDVYSRTGKRKEAIALLEELYEKNPENHNALKTLGGLYADAHDYDRALEVLNAYNEKTGGDYHSHHVLGDVLSAMGDKAGAEREYRKALDLIRRENR